MSWSTTLSTRRADDLGRQRQLRKQGQCRSQRNALLLEARELLGRIARLPGDRVRHHVDAGGDHGLNAGRVLRMGEHRLALRVRDIDRGLGDGRVHVHDWLVFALVGAGEQFDAVEADAAYSSVPSPPLRSGVAASGSCISGGKIGGMAIPWENAADEENIGPEDFVRIDAAAQRQRVAQGRSRDSTRW